MSGQALVWFGIAGGGAAFAASLLHARYIQRTPQAVRSRGSFTLFALLMLLFALGATAAGFAALRAS
ncbi:MAG: hypothetical protein H0T49_02385 [Chloroflexia bacterium]|jgi:hypothetical protein|nr:hypothetical protein [Chloroflexia bacterium]